jgi:triacylglycerol lipase
LAPEADPQPSDGSPGRLARLQQGITLGLLALAVLALLWAWRDGRWALGLGIAALLLLGHALVLGFEFACLRLAHGDDPTPRASVRQLVSAWWHECRTAPIVFCWRQPFRSRQEPDHLPSAAAGRTGVLFVHGFVCNRGLWNPWLQALRQQGVPFVAVNLEPVFGSIDDYVPLIEQAVRRLEQATGRAPVAVCHSMGGLALRRWWAERGDDARLAHVFTLGTPHHGTWLARFAVSRNGLQMRRHSRWLATLAAREPQGRAERFTCFYSHCDNIVFPPATATLAGADNRHLDGVAHVHLAERDEPRQALLQRLSALDGQDLRR